MNDYAEKSEKNWYRNKKLTLGWKLEIINGSYCCSIFPYSVDPRSNETKS